MTEDAYNFDARLAHAATPPASWYTDARVLDIEQRKVFGRTWQLVGRTEQVREAGQFFTATVADEPVIVARGLDGRLRAFSNVCRHRAGPVAEGAGRRRSFRCGYHGWTYALDGRLLVTPEFEGVECWNRDAHALPEFRVDVWGALVFVNLDAEAAPLAATLEDLPERVGHRNDWDEMRPAARKEWHVACNWKTYVDNYLEGYHIPVVHPGLARELDYRRYRTETRRLYSIQHAPVRRERATRIAAGEGEDAAQYFWVFPNLMLNVYPDNYSTNLIVPLAPERTLTVFEWYFKDAERADVREAVRRTVEFSDEIQVEDIQICEAVQRGLRSRTYTSGRYSVARENGVHHFHGLLAHYLAD
ncbi:MAG TPA: aromatic ring-hydroxylating dioxygenase subunit alpha [Pyrinomonadaceae bacterium]|nr:aromatic ring-hydroxylating dioxygenase subunit alpha [Pyrinomonadaceae bacterium]